MTWQAAGGTGHDGKADGGGRWRDQSLYSSSWVFHLLRVFQQWQESSRLINCSNTQAGVCNVDKWNNASHVENVSKVPLLFTTAEQYSPSPPTENVLYCVLPFLTSQRAQHFMIDHCRLLDWSLRKRENTFQHIRSFLSVFIFGNISIISHFSFVTQNSAWAECCVTTLLSFFSFLPTGFFLVVPEKQAAVKSTDSPAV